MKNVIVTGAGRGLGLAICQRLLDEGYCVIGTGRSLTDDFQLLINTYSANRVDFIPWDLSEPDTVHVFSKTVFSKHKTIYGLVNNAGMGADGVLGTMHTSEIDAILNLNLRSAIYLTKYISRRMLSNREGRIINISSIIAQTGFSGLAVYAASKAGLEGFTKSLSRELGRMNITVNCVAPGYMETDMTANLDGEKFETIRRRSPLGLARVGDAAAAVTYLLGSDAERLTGSVITVDGGSTA